jgi:DNA-binding Lrp family transcriptional regulator
VTDDELLAVWQQDPKASDAQVADKVHLTRSAVQQRRIALQDRGVLMKTEQGIVIYLIPEKEEAKV